MRNIFILFFSFLSFQIFSQTPQKINYQAVARNSSGQLLANQPVSVKFDLHPLNTTSTPVYTETHNVTTNGFGLFMLEIGNGSVVTGNFSAVNWATGVYFLEISIDVNGGSSYVSFGNQQLMSVPYALYAEKSGNSSPTPTITTNTPNTVTNPSAGVYNLNVPTPSLSVNSNSLAISNGNTVVLPSATSQTLSITGNTLDISNGNSVVLPSAASQTLSITGNTIDISNGNSVVLPPESQTLSITGNTVDISNGNSIVLPTPATQTLSITGNTLDISNGNSVILPTTDSQTLSITGNTIDISNGNSIVLPTPATQTLSITGNTLDISNGNSVTLPVSTTYSAGPGIDISLGVISNTMAPQTLSVSGNAISISNGNTQALPSYSLTRTGSNIDLTQDGTTIATVSITPNQTVTITGPNVLGSHPNFTITPYVGDASNISVSGNTISLINTGVTPATYGGVPYTVPTFSVDAYGRLRAANSFTPSVAGDLTGTIDAATVTKIQTRPVSNTAPILNQVLTWNGSAWAPVTPATAPVPNLVGTGVVTVNNASPNYTVSVPMSTYNNGTGVFTTGTQTISVAPTLTLSGNVLRSGPTTNTVDLSNLTGAWTNTLGLIYPTTITNTVSIGTSAPLGGRFEILHTASQANPTMHLRETTGGLNRIKFSNNTVAGKYFETAAQTNASDANGAYSINYFDGTTYKPVFLVTGERKVSVNNLNTVLSSFHVMENATTTAGGGIVSEGFAQPGQIIIARNNQTALVRLAVINGDEIGRLMFSGFNGASYAGTSAKISVSASENFTGSSQGSEMLFSTVKNGTTAQNDVLRLTNSGDVIINPNNNISSATVNVKGKLILDSTITMSAYNTPPNQSPVNAGRIYYDRATNRFKVSENGGAYVNLLGVPSPWAYNPGVMYPLNNASTDKVAIGQASANSMLDVMNSVTSTVTTSPVVNIQNANSSFTGQGVLQISKSTGGGALLYASNTHSVGDGLSVNMSNANNGSNAVQVQQFGLGNAGYFEVNNTSSTASAISANSNGGAPVIRSIQNGTGEGGNILVNNSSNANVALRVKHIGTSDGVYSEHYGTNGSAGVFASGNSSNTRPAVFAQTNGQGSAGFFEHISASSNANAVTAVTYGTGSTIFGNNMGTAGYAGYFNIPGGSTNTSAAVFASNIASGNALDATSNAGYAVNATNSSSVNATIYANNTGQGKAVYGISNSNSDAAGYFYNTGSYDGVGAYSNGGRAVYAQSSSSTGYSGIEGIHYGTGHGLLITKPTGSSGSVARFNNVETSNISDAVWITNSGTGHGMLITKPGSTTSGNAARFENLSTANSADAIMVTNNGAGSAIHAVCGPTVTGGTNVAIQVENGHLKTNQTGAALAKVDLAASSLSNYPIGSTDVAGSINIATGASHTAGQQYVRITFSKAYAVPPVVILTPVTSAAALVGAYVTTTANDFTINFANTTAAGPVVNFTFNYMVIEGK